MKKIYFMRHAKANEGDDDFARDLSERGKKDLALICERLRELKISADMVFSSSAKRSEKTANKVASSLKIGKKIKLKKELYEISLSEILSFINQIDERLNEIFIIGHNSVITEISELLSDSAIGNIPTSGVFGVEFDCDFAEIKPHCGRALFFEYPKKYKEKK